MVKGMRLPEAIREAVGEELAVRLARLGREFDYKPVAFTDSWMESLTNPFMEF